MSKMLEVVIDSVRVSLMSPQRLVVLRQVDADRFLPIWVGPYEAEAITVALNEIEMVRPLTHDLLKNVITTFNGRVMRVEIVAMRDDIYYGNIVIDVDGKTLNIDARPSDSIALAVRAHVPILVDEGVMETSGTTPEKDLQAQTPPPAPLAKSTTPIPSPSESKDERLSIFEDFLSKIDLDQTPGKDKDKDSDKDDDGDDKPKKKK
jgi:uncharacterized protein